MKSLLIFQTMSVPAAVILIIALLLVAGLIGYLTAWFYAKSVYTPIIKGLEDDKVKLNQEISGLKDDIRNLNVKIDGLEKKVDELELEVSEKEKLISEKVNIINEQEGEINSLKKKINS
jgi:peptidoglycan hydrolase CwlO-like protein